MRTLILLFIINSFSFLAQDSSKVFTYDNFIEQVMHHHPYARLAAIRKETGDAQLLQSRGAFDPKLTGDADQKYFDGKKYYSHLGGGLKIPTWFGLTAEAGYKQNEGIYLNPENRLPDVGLWYAGLRLELGNGLIIDQRRAELQKAMLAQDAGELEQKIVLNELRRNASIAYYEWQRSYAELQIYSAAMENAQLRLNATKQASLFGDRPSIDTVEASILLKNRQISLLNAQAKYFAATQKTEIYLWDDGYTPLELNNSIPEITGDIDRIAELVDTDSLVNGHPFVLQNQLKLEQAEIDLRLKREQIKPQLTLKYNALSEPVNNNPFNTFSVENYTWGATFALPLFLRKERGGIQLANLKYQDQEIKLKMESAQLDMNLNNLYNNYAIALEQYALMKELSASNQSLFNAEKELFDLGESSVFMINSRENSWLSAQNQEINSAFQVKALEAELNFLLMKD
jgi:outer membrane protein TolC